MLCVVDEFTSAALAIREAQVLIEKWRGHQDRSRPYSSLGYRPPAPETVQWPGRRSAHEQVLRRWPAEIRPRPLNENWSTSRAAVWLLRDARRPPGREGPLGSLLDTAHAS